MSEYKTAGIIIIGNEILSGRVRDENAYFFAVELRSLGVDVRKISIVPDEEDIIGEEVRRFSEAFDLVFTSGGVGPTHDDVTMASIAKGFGVGLTSNKLILDILKKVLGKPLNRAALKMTMIPEGAEVIFNEHMRFPVVLFRNIYIFPGVPDYMKNKFNIIKERFRTRSYLLRRVYLKGHESDFAEILNQVVKRNSDVMFGSYPVPDNAEYEIVVTVESKSEESLERAMHDLFKSLPSNMIQKIE